MNSHRAVTDDPTTLIEVTETSPGLYTGHCIDGLNGRVFGGQSLGQALRAASMALDDARPPNSIHCYFVAPGASSDPVTYRTQVVKRGRSLDIVEVNASQGSRTLLTGHASFHEPEPSLQFQPLMPAVPPPHALPPSKYFPAGTNEFVRRPFDVRYVDDRFHGESGPMEPIQDVWIRTLRPVGSDRWVDHAALLAFAVDFLVSRASHLPLRGGDALDVGASLDHAMWFHRSFRADMWLLVCNVGVTYAGARAMSQCSVFDLDGALVASASQEALIRPLGDAAGAEEEPS